MTHAFESIVDIERETYAPGMFENPEAEQPELKESVRQQLLDIAEPFYSLGMMKSIFVKGSILTKRYADDTDVDLTLEMRFDSEEEKDRAREEAKAVTGQKIFVEGTQHPIDLYLYSEEYDPTSFDDIYDIPNDRWVKQSKINYPDFADFLGGFSRLAKHIDLERGQLQRDLIDYSQLSRLSSESVETIRVLIEAKIQAIDDQVRKLASIYRVMHGLRGAGFKRVYTPEQLKEMQTKNLLPGNIIYKLLEKYHYIRFLRELAIILRGAEGKIDEPSEVDVLMKYVEAGVDEMTTAGAAGSYEVPLGARPPGRKKRRRVKKNKKHYDLLGQ